MWRLAYRNFGTHESLVTSQSVEAAPNMAGIRWYEVRDPNGTPTVFQQGTYAPGVGDGIHRWMGSIAMDNAGNMALGYSASNGTTTFPSSWYTGRLAGDPLGTMPQGEGSFINGTGSQTGSGRWGDYTSMNVDPVDDCTFWYVNEYVPVTSSVGWRLRIGAFKFDECEPAVIHNVQLSDDMSAEGSAGDAVEYTVSITNTGNVSDTYDLTVSDNNWTTDFSTSNIFLDAGASATFAVSVTIPVNAGGGESDNAMVEATSTGDSNVSDEVNLTTSVELLYGVNVTGDMSGEGQPGDEVNYVVMVANEGNVTDTYTVTLSGENWMTTLSDTSVTVEAGASALVTVTVSIPAGVSPGDDDTVTVTATSAGDPGVSDDSDITTTAIPFTTYMPVIFKEP